MLFRSRLVARRRTFLSLVLGQPQASNASVRLSLSEFASRMIPESTGLQDRGLLAQPSSVQSPAAKPSKDTKALKEGADREWFATEQRAELDYRVPTKGALDWSDRLSGSDLDANGIIEHVYYLTKQRGPTEEEMRAWQASRWESLDRKLGILRLLSAVANYDN